MFIIALRTTSAEVVAENFSTIVKEHIHQVIEPKQVGKVLPWVHIAIANAKRLLLDVYHDIRPEYLQNYLNEFC